MEASSTPSNTPDAPVASPDTPVATEDQTTEGQQDDNGTTETEATVPVDYSDFDSIALAVADTNEAVRLDEDHREDVVSTIAQVHKIGARWAQHGVDMLRLRKELAKLAVQLMPFVLLAGRPDWDGTSASFKVLFDKVLDRLLDEKGTDENKLTTGDKRKLINAVRQHIKRTYLDPAIRAWLYDTTKEIRDSMPNGRTAAGTFKDHDSEVFRHAIKREYQRCNLAVPDRYLSSEEQSAKADARGSGGPGPGAEDPAAAIRAAMAGIESMAPHWAAAELLQGLSSLALRLTDLKAEPEYRREATSDLLQRTELVAGYLVRFIDGKAGDRTEIEDLLWNPEKDSEAIASV